MQPHPSPRGLRDRLKTGINTTWLYNRVDRLSGTCQVYLNMDLDDDAPALSLEVALSVAGTPGAIVIFRNEAPAIGSLSHITPPPGVTLPQG